MRKLLSLFISGILAATTLVAISSPQAFAAATLTTCTNLETGKTLVLRSADPQCRSHLGSALWVQEQSDSSALTGDGYASITICSSKNPLSTYRLIKDSCPKFLVSTNYWRTVAAPATPIIEAANARGYDSAALFITPSTSAPSALVLYYLVTDMKSGLTSKVRPGNSGQLLLSNLSSLTSYTFTIAAVSVDGTSLPSSITPVITTGAAPVVVVASTAAALAAPAFTLSSSSETRTVNTAATGFTINSTGGAIASFAINATPAGMGFETSTGTLSGTPNTAAVATAYTITATNATGSATQTFTLTVAIAAPAFTLSSSAETKTVNTAAIGFTISSTGGAIASFAISAIPAGMSFSTSTGALTGTPNTVASATAYTITATNATGSTTRIFTLTVTAVIVYEVGETGPGGGTIFYVATTPFACGPARASTCTYLEAAPSGWNTGSDPARRWADSSYQSTTINNPTSPETATATAIGWGYWNTRAIVLQGNTNTATNGAALADAHTVTVSGVVYDDWYLPSKDELNQMCKWARGITGDALTNLSTVCFGGTLNSGVGALGFALSDYWSSTETAANTAINQNFHYNFQGSNSKSYDATPIYIRPVRAF